MARSWSLLFLLLLSLLALPIAHAGIAECVYSLTPYAMFYNTPVPGYTNVSYNLYSSTVNTDPNGFFWGYGSWDLCRDLPGYDNGFGWTGKLYRLHTETQVNLTIESILNPDAGEISFNGIHVFDIHANNTMPYTPPYMPGYKIMDLPNPTALGSVVYRYQYQSQNYYDTYSDVIWQSNGFIPPGDYWIIITGAAGTGTNVGVDIHSSCVPAYLNQSQCTNNVYKEKIINNSCGYEWLTVENCSQSYCDGNTRYYGGTCTSNGCEMLSENCTNGCENGECVSNAAVAMVGFMPTSGSEKSNNKSNNSNFLVFGGAIAGLIGGGAIGAIAISKYGFGRKNGFSFAASAIEKSINRIDSINKIEKALTKKGRPALPAFENIPFVSRAKETLKKFYDYNHREEGNGKYAGNHITRGKTYIDGIDAAKFTEDRIAANAKIVPAGSIPRGDAYIDGIPARKFTEDRIMSNDAIKNNRGVPPGYDYNPNTGIITERPTPPGNQHSNNGTENKIDSKIDSNGVPLNITYGYEIQLPDGTIIPINVGVSGEENKDDFDINFLSELLEFGSNAVQDYAKYARASSGGFATAGNESYKILQSNLSKISFRFSKVLDKAGKIAGIVALPLTYQNVENRVYNESGDEELANGVAAISTSLSILPPVIIYDFAIDGLQLGLTGAAGISRLLGQDGLSNVYTGISDGAGGIHSDRVIEGLAMSSDTSKTFTRDIGYVTGNTVRGAEVVVNGAGYVADNTVRGAEVVVNSVSNGAGYVADNTVRGAEVVVNGVGNGIGYVADNVARGAEVVASGVGSLFCGLFSKPPENP